MIYTLTLTRNVLLLFRAQRSNRHKNCRIGALMLHTWNSIPNSLLPGIHQAKHYTRSSTCSQEKGLWWLLHKSTKISLGYSWEGFMQNMPPVTHGKDLCKTCFAQILHNYILFTLSSWEGFMQKLERVDTHSLPWKWLWISLLHTAQYEGVSSISFVAFA